MVAKVANWLKKDMHVDEALFLERKQQRVCFACGSSDHILYACPQYTPAIMDKVATKKFGQGVTAGVQERERGRYREQRMRDNVQGLTKKGVADQWKGKFRRDRAQANMMEDGEKFPERAMHRSQRFGKSEPPDACSVDSLDTESSGGDSGSDASMNYMQDFMATRPQRRRSGNGGQGQHRR
jgi:hypothetical protein